MALYLLFMKLEYSINHDDKMILSNEQGSASFFCKGSFVKKFIFSIFSHLAKIFSGHGLRRKFPMLDRIFKKINRGLAVEKVVVGGHTIYLDRDDSMKLASQGIYEPKETELMQSLVSPGDIVFDLGANIGYFTLILARLVEPNGRVYAFEPHPDMFALLQKNIVANGYQNVFLAQQAVTNKASSLTLFADPFYNLDHRIFSSMEKREGIPIQSVRLDDILCDLPQVNFIKMDIQGAEALALSGMQQIIERSPMAILFTEFWPSGLKEIGSSPEEYFADLKRLGFQIFDIEGPEGLEQETTIEELLMRNSISSMKHTNLLCRK